MAHTLGAARCRVCPRGPRDTRGAAGRGCVPGQKFN